MINMNTTTEGYVYIFHIVTSFMYSLSVAAHMKRLLVANLFPFWYMSVK